MEHPKIELGDSQRPLRLLSLGMFLEPIKPIVRKLMLRRWRWNPGPFVSIYS